MNKVDKHWYKTAIFMELNVRAYRDSNADGWGDLPGLTSKLNYIKDLGVDAVWLLPIMPSPLRDDGYDVSDFKSIFPPAYGTIEDFNTLISEAHKRGIRIIVEIIPPTTVQTCIPGFRLRATLITLSMKSIRTGTFGLTPTRNIRTRALSLPTAKLPTGRGTKCAVSTFGTAFIQPNPI